ncbi:MAG: peroxiredoxin family protein [Verrucomicrobia bacterium]|nr:peroxiredoxin family protein [Verrucomicrobiota bacterium]
MSPGQGVIASLLTCLVGAGLCGLVAPRRRLAGWVAFAATALSSGLALYAAGKALALGSVEPEMFLKVESMGFALTLHIDGLSAFFILLIASIALPAVFYSIDYMESYPEYGVGRYYPLLLIFIAALYGLVSTTDMMWFFFIFWQMMTVPGFLLIRFERQRAENRRAALKFLVMMEIACAATMAGAELLAGAPVSGAAAGGGAALKYDFATVSSRLPALLEQRSLLTAAAFALFLAGFGIKLGMWPFGRVWLPDAHPAAPSPMSAMLSGVMLKTGVYGVMRYFLWLVPLERRAIYPAWEWGAVMTILGTITLLTGTAQALKQEQTKRLLAFHSIGQLGYILFGVGMAMLLLGMDDPRLEPLAVAAFAGALLHTLHHATFKSLLFLNAGSVLWSTGTQDLNRLGGLARWMPWTAITALIASMSISGVPGLNGFISKWALYVAGVEGWPAASWLPVCAAIAILTSALTLASFVKFFGAGFLGRSSAYVERKARERGRLEVPWRMQVSQWLLAVVCVVAGLLPAVTFGLVQLALKAGHRGLGAVFGTMSPATPAFLAGVRTVGQGVVIAVLVVLGIAAGMALAWLLSCLGGAPRRRVEPWLCGYATHEDSMRVTAHGLYGHLKSGLSARGLARMMWSKAPTREWDKNAGPRHTASGGKESGS